MLHFHLYSKMEGGIFEGKQPDEPNGVVLFLFYINK